MRWEIEVGGRMRDVYTHGAAISLDGQPVHVDAVRTGHLWSLILDPVTFEGPAPTRSYEVAIVEHAAGDLTVHVNGRPIAVRSSNVGRGRPGVGRSLARGLGASAAAGTEGPQRIVAPMPGRVAKVLVRVGESVAARQGLVVVEAMKMESELRSPRAGTVTEVLAVEGALVGANAVLVVVE